MSVQEVGLEAVGAGRGDFAGDHLQEKNKAIPFNTFLLDIK